MKYAVFVAIASALWISCARARPESPPGADCSGPHPDRAFAIALDASKSVREDEFGKFKVVLQDLVHRTVGFGDALWLVPITGDAPRSKKFAMPNHPTGRTREANSEANRQLESCKQLFLDRLDQLAQSESQTNLHDAVALGLEILAQQQAASRALIVMSDFVEDVGGRASVSCSEWPWQNIRASGVTATLIFGDPKEPYLRKIGVRDGNQLFSQAKDAWLDCMKKAGVRAQMRLVDSY